MMKQTVLLDLDGTLTDPGLGITNSVLYALSQFGIEEKRENLYAFIGPPLVPSFMKRYGFSEEKAREAVRHFRVYFQDRGMYENTLYKGIPALLSTLKARGFSVVLASSKPEEFAVRILRHFEIFPYFDAVCGAEMDEKGRVEKTDVIAYALQTVGADPKECVMVGDRKFDILGGKENGTKTIGVLYGYGTKRELAAAGADALCATVSDLQKTLLSIKEEKKE